MIIQNYMDFFTAEQTSTFEYLFYNWKTVLVELPLYSDSLRLFLISKNVITSLENLEETLLKLEKLIPNYILIKKYNTKVPGCSQMIVDYLNFDPLYNNDNKLDLEPTQTKYTSLKDVLADDSSYLRDERRTMKELLLEPTSIQIISKERALSEPMVPFIDTCRLSTRECSKTKNGLCNKIHFQAIIRNNTDVSLGDCSYLNTCFKGKNCRYVHYQISVPDIAKVPQIKTNISRPIIEIGESLSRTTVSTL